MMKDKCICYIGMATRLALLRVHWQLYLRNMYPWHIYTNFYFYIYIYICIFQPVHQFLLRLPIWFESIVHLDLAHLLYIISCAADVAVVERFLVLTRVVPFVLILSAMPRNMRELMQLYIYIYIYIYILKSLCLMAY